MYLLILLNNFDNLLSLILFERFDTIWIIIEAVISGKTISIIIFIILFEISSPNGE